MSRLRARSGRLCRPVLTATAALAAVSLALAVTGLLAVTGATPRASGLAGVGGEPYVYTDDSVSAQGVMMIGATPSETGGGRYETWGLGNGASGPVLVRYTQEAGWSLGPGLQGEGAAALTGFALDTPQAFSTHSGPSPIAGQMTADGAGVLAGSVEEGKRQVLLVREPGNPANAFRETKPVPEGDIEHGEKPFGLQRAPLIVPLDEPGGHAGALVAPIKEHSLSGEEQILHWEGEKEAWTREKIELPASASSTEFRVLGIGASSPENAWLLGQLSSSEGVALFRRQVEGGEAVWKPVALKSGGEPGEALTVEGEKIAIPGAQQENVQTQVLTVTGQGVWIDGERPTARASTTIFFKPEGASGAPSLTSWCTLEHSASGTAPCEHALPQALPTGPSRSIAWEKSSSSTPFGERVITGLPEGVSLRLDGESFTPVLGLGGSGPQDEGATYGAAFASPTEGWLGNSRLPVHVTLEPPVSRLAPWPVSFRHALTAVAPEPGAPIGSLSSEALAVGDLGEVARYKPGQGWLPESLLGAGEQRETPRLRAVAWPTPNRAYAVGDRNETTGLGQMWLWRGETGLWEPDPATPYNFSGNLLGIAFEPGEPNLGYAVGQSGVLLRYGKTWTQEPYPAESPCPHSTSPRCTWANASFTSISFAGSEAIVAYRVLPNTSIEHYEGGLLVNSGSGWHIDQGAEAAMGSNVPWAVAGLPDGGAAFGASETIYERQASGAPWEATPTPYPGGGQPASLALFRENGALRVVATGTVPDTDEVERVAEAPPGAPPTQIKPYPLGSSPEAGVLRQTATGWSDQEHELNDAKEPEGNWSSYDEVYQPDPISAALVNPEGGSQGWAIGGFVEPEKHGGVLDTADVDRYPAEGSPPPGVGASPIGIGSNEATFAIGGNAQCAAPCAARANARVGPDVWLATALERAHIPGARAFLYTGPRLVSPHATNGPKETVDTIDYASELGRYAEILGGSRFPVYAAASPTDLNEAGSEGPFEQAFSLFASPFGGGAAQPELAPVGRGEESCHGAPECPSDYYALESTGAGGTVRVIMLDGTAEFDSAQLIWLEGELGAAKTAGQPAIVVGNPDLSAEIAAGNHPGASAVARVLVQDEASAYFFDSPEENIQEPLRAAGGSIPSFGSGTLGYVKYGNEASGEFLGASGFLLVEVGAWDSEGGHTPVHVQLIPNVGELALEGEEGTLLRRSHAALFDALARRPRAGNRTTAAGSASPETNPYIPIPSVCRGATCASGLFPKYEFISSDAEIGGFVKQNLLGEPKGHEPLYNAKGEPEKEPVINGESISTKSGLFCAYNATKPGQPITITVRAGGLSASLQVTVQAGSVRQPCGTTPLSGLSSPEQAAPAPAPPPTSPAPAGAAPASSSAPPPAPPPPPPLAAAPTPPVRPTPAPPAPFFIQPALPFFVPAFVPPPLPAPAEPTPPTGTSAVTSPVEAAQKEEEEEEATESVSAQALAYRAPEHEPTPLYVLGVVTLAAFAGAAGRRRPRRGRREVRIAPATISTMRTQRRISTFRGRRS